MLKLEAGCPLNRWSLWRPDLSRIGIWGRVSNSVNLGVSMAGKEGGKVLPLKKLSKVSWNSQCKTLQWLCLRIAEYFLEQPAESHFVSLAAEELEEVGSYFASNLRHLLDLNCCLQYSICFAQIGSSCSAAAYVQTFAHLRCSAAGV